MKNKKMMMKKKKENKSYVESMSGRVHHHRKPSSPITIIIIQKQKQKQKKSSRTDRPGCWVGQELKLLGSKRAHAIANLVATTLSFECELDIDTFLWVLDLHVARLALFVPAEFVSVRQAESQTVILNIKVLDGHFILDKLFHSVKTCELDLNTGTRGHTQVTDEQLRKKNT